MHYFDCILPTCIVSKEGTILLQNQGFENLVRNNFDLKGAPPLNILKIIASDPVSKDKLQKTI